MIKDEDKIKLFDILVQGNIQRIYSNPMLKLIIENVVNKLKLQEQNKQKNILHD